MEYAFRNLPRMPPILGHCTQTVSMVIQDFTKLYILNPEIRRGWLVADLEEHITGKDLADCFVD